MAVYYYLFDLLHWEGYDLTELPLRTRKSLLKGLLNFADPIRFTSHRNEAGEAYLKEACGKGWEGLIAKRAGAPYRSQRSRDWLKFKCGRRQELVVVGYTEPSGSRVGFGALLVGYYENQALCYAGRVGTGFDDDFLERFRDQLEGAELEQSPLAAPPREQDVHWVRPRFVAEIGFTEWTDDGKLRHPRFLGLRRDKDPKEVVREQA